MDQLSHPYMTTRKIIYQMIMLLPVLREMLSKFMVKPEVTL